MKPHMSSVAIAILAVVLTNAPLQAQQRSSNPQGQRQGQQDVTPPGLAGVPLDGRRGRTVTAGGSFITTRAWWTNTVVVQQLGLTDDQKAKIEKAFENHRLGIVSSTAGLEKEEAQLAKLLDADPIERNVVLSQIDRVIQARNEMERETSVMTMEMREYLTHAQWAQLQALQPSLQIGYSINGLGPSPAQRFGRGAAPAPTPTEPGGRGRGRGPQ